MTEIYPSGEKKLIVSVKTMPPAGIKQYFKKPFSAKKLNLTLKPPRLRETWKKTRL